MALLLLMVLYTYSVSWHKCLYPRWKVFQMSHQCAVSFFEPFFCSSYTSFETGDQNSPLCSRCGHCVFTHKFTKTERHVLIYFLCCFPYSFCHCNLLSWNSKSHFWGLADFLIQSPSLTLTFCQVTNVCLHLFQVKNAYLHLSYIFCPLISYFINAKTFHYNSEQPRSLRSFGWQTLKIFWKAKQKAITTSPFKLPHPNTLRAWGFLHRATALIYSYFIFTHYSSWRFLPICTSTD